MLQHNTKKQCVSPAAVKKDVGVVVGACNALTSIWPYARTSTLLYRYTNYVWYAIFRSASDHMRLLHTSICILWVYLLCHKSSKSRTLYTMEMSLAANNHCVGLAVNITGDKSSWQASLWPVPHYKSWHGGLTVITYNSCKRTVSGNYTIFLYWAMHTSSSIKTGWKSKGLKWIRVTLGQASGTEQQATP